MLTLIIGGSASGKSEYAERHVCTLPGQKIYLAAMRPWDEECVRRIERHRCARSGKGFDTIEWYGEPAKPDIPEKSNILLEDLSNLLADISYAENAAGGEPDPAAEISCAMADSDPAVQTVLHGINFILDHAAHLTIVTNDIFADGNHYDPETLLFMRRLAALNRALAARADVVCEVVCAQANILKGL